MHEALADAGRRVVGTKQLLRALDEGKLPTHLSPAMRTCF